MKQYIIDFSQYKNYPSFWDFIHRSLDLPFWCGCNIDAIWDMLTGYMERPCEITILSYSQAPKDWEWSHTKIVEAIKRAHDQGWGVDYEIRE